MAMDYFVVGVQVFFLIFARILGFMIASPFWNNTLLYFRFKNMVVIFTAYIVLPVVQSHLHLIKPIPFTFFWFFFMKNMALGLGIGFFLFMLFSIFQIVGEYWGIQIGFSISQVFDPSTGDQSPILGQLVSFLALLVFTSVGGHLKIIELLVYSFNTTPLMGSLNHLPDLLLGIITGVTSLFKNSLVLAFTLMGSIFVATLFIGLLAKAAPQLNVMIFGMPVYVILGFLILLFLIPNFVYFSGNYIENMIERVGHWLTLSKQ